MRASVCVATCDRADRLPALFAALAAQTVPPSEVVVADDGSTDDTPAVLADLAVAAPYPVRVLRLAVNGGAARARNAAWRAATGDRVLFTDDDCLPAPGWVAAHLAAAAELDVVVGATGPAPGEVADGPYARVLRVGDARFFQTCNVSYRRGDLEAVDGFDELFRHSGEDTDLGLRVAALGVRVGFAADAVVVHPIRPSSLRAALAQTPRWADLARVVCQHPDVRRDLMHRRLFWKPTHPPTLLALAGLAVVRPRPGRVALAAGLALPWLRARRGVPATALAGTFACDAAEVAAMVRGSVRHRTPIL